MADDSIATDTVDTGIDTGVDTPMMGIDESSDSGDSSAGEEAQVDWLVTGREKRSTAGNRLSTLLQQTVAADDDLELLFAEDEEDGGFEASEDDSDVQMDSSSDDDDQGPTAGDDDMEGERELERQAKIEKKAKKRNMSDAIPKRLRQKLKADPATAGQAERPKKKSERSSWIPTPEDAPTRASARQTTKLSKQQLHAQMIDREAKRLRLLEKMEKAAKRKEANKPKILTQAERLAEAARIEKMNSKSLNRWEEAEKQREEERRAKLAALNNRKLEGPVITWWSGRAEVWDGKLRKVGKVLVDEREKEAKPRKRKAAEMEANTPTRATAPAKDAKLDAPVAPVSKHDTTPGEAKPTLEKPAAPTITDPPKSEGSVSAQPADSNDEAVKASASSKETNGVPLTNAVEDAVMTGDVPAEPVETPSVPVGENAQDSRAEETSIQEPADSRAALPDEKPQGATAAPCEDIQERPSGAISTDHQTKAPTLQLNDVEMTDAPPGADLGPTVETEAPAEGKPMTDPEVEPTSNVDLKEKNDEGTISMENDKIPPADHPPAPILESTTPQPRDDVETQQRTQSETPHVDNQTKEPAKPKVVEAFTRNCLILENFNDDAIKQKDVQAHIIFGRKIPRAQKPPQPELCVITALPAKYRDPSTGLPYLNAYAYKEIQRAKNGFYRWSTLMQSYLGQSQYAARGVPDRFLGKAKTEPAPPAQQTQPAPPAQPRPAAPVTAPPKAAAPAAQVSVPASNAAANPSVPASAPASAPVSVPVSTPASASASALATASTPPAPATSAAPAASV